MTTPKNLAEILGANIEDTLRQELRQDPSNAIPKYFDVEVQIVPEGSIHGNCNLSGLYTDRRPNNCPLIQVVSSDHKPRFVFTLLHELGHYLINTNDQVAEFLMYAPDHGARLEERVADQFAADMLIERSLTNELFADGLTADAVVELIKRSPEASIAACLVTAASFQTTEGYVVMARNGSVRRAVPTGGAIAIRPGGQHPADHPLSAADSPRGYSRIRIVGRDGVKSQEFAVHATAFDGDIYAVFTTDLKPPWGPVRTGLSNKAEYLDVDCDRCDRSTWGYKICDKCDAAICAEEDPQTGDRCGWCLCFPPGSTRVCECGFKKTPNQFPDPSSNVCVDCL